MTEPNLAIVFAPNLLRPQDDSMLKLIEDARYANGITKILLEEYDYLIAVSLTHFILYLFYCFYGL